MSKNLTQFSLVQKYPLKWSSKNKKSEKNKKCPPNGGKKRGRKVRSEKKCPPNGEKKKRAVKKKNGGRVRRALFAPSFLISLLSENIWNYHDSIA